MTLIDALKANTHGLIVKNVFGVLRMEGFVFGSGVLNIEST